MCCFSAFPDYDAVLTEAGDYTSKFFKLRQLFSMVIGNDRPRSCSSHTVTPGNCLNWPFCWSPGALLAWELRMGGILNSCCLKSLFHLSFCLPGQPLPLPPLIESKASYGAILLHQYISLWDVLPALLQVMTPLSMHPRPKRHQFLGQFVLCLVIPKG